MEGSPSRPIDLEPCERRLMLALWAALFLFYIAIMSGTHYSSDGMLMFQQGRTLVGSHTLTFPQPIRWSAQFLTSKYGLGMSLAYVPWLGVLASLRPELFRPDYFSATPANDPALLANSLYFYSSWLNPLLAAVTAVLLYRLGRVMQLSIAASLFAALLLGLASPLAAYARFDFAQPLVAVSLVGAYLFIVQATGTGRLRYWVLAGLCMGYGFLTRADSIIAVPWLYMLCFAPGRRSRLRGMAVMSSLLALGMLAYLVVNWIKFGSPFQFGYEGAFAHPQWLEGWLGLLAGPGTGILVFFPLTLLAVSTLVRDVRRRSLQAVAVLGIVVSYWLAFGLWDEWWGGWSWGPRFLVPIIPFLALYAVRWLSRRAGHARLRAAAFGALALLGWAAAVNGILFNFLAFYGNYYAQRGGAAEFSSEQFLPALSPLFAGYDWAQRLHAYDLYWLNYAFHARSWAARIEAGTLLAIFVLAVALLGRVAFTALRREREAPAPPEDSVF